MLARAQGETKETDQYRIYIWHEYKFSSIFHIKYGFPSKCYRVTMHGNKQAAAAKQARCLDLLTQNRTKEGSADGERLGGGRAGAGGGGGRSAEREEGAGEGDVVEGDVVVYRVCHLPPRLLLFMYEGVVAGCVCGGLVLLSVRRHVSQVFSRLLSYENAKISSCSF